jgi:heavy metal translocating P-type ATPase
MASDLHAGTAPSKPEPVSSSQFTIKQNWIAALALTGMAVHLILRAIPHAWGAHTDLLLNLPLLLVLFLGGGPLVIVLMGKLLRREFGSDLLAGISIVTALALHEYLAGALVVLMLSGGETLEAYAATRASSSLAALAARLPTTAYRKDATGLIETPIDQIRPGDVVVVFPHAICPVDGTVVEGHGSMDEAYLTGEPYSVSKAPGIAVLSGAINGESALSIACDRPASDSRYARIMQVMRDSEQHRPRLRRLGDQLGALYTPLAVAIAVAAWAASGDPSRFLAVLVVATPCPLLIAIPVAIVGSVSVAARKGIIIKNPAVLEQISRCRVAIFDKTGTLTYGKPKLTEVVVTGEIAEEALLSLVASLERYSKHPLASAILDAAQERGIALQDATDAREMPGDGMRAAIDGHVLHVTGRSKLVKDHPKLDLLIPPPTAGMECLVTVDGALAGAFHFRDEPRPEGAHFIQHLNPRHHVERVMLVSGDRQAEVAYLAEQVGITEVYAAQSPEQKLALVRRETAKAPTVFLGDGINDAPSLTAATVGIAFGNKSDITSEAADAVVLDSSLETADILLHIGKRMRQIALQSAVGGMALSVIGMGLAAFGLLPPVVGAVSQEVIDVLAVVNALRAGLPSGMLSDC